MIISLNWLKKYTDIDLATDELATLIGARLVEIEGVEDLGEKYKDVIIAKVVECTKVEGSDHLNLTKIDDGGRVKDIERDASGYVQVVCGAPNVHAGLLVAWLPPESIVPETYSEKEPFVLGAKELRGLKSHGMLASAKELDLYDDHSGILEVDIEAKPGDSFAAIYELDDYLLDIENKSLTHRPDTFGIVGFAREVAGIQGLAFHTPEWLQALSASSDVADPLELKVSIDDSALSDRYQAVVLTGASADATTPIDIQTLLARSGVRSISPIVDVTNYMMLVSGQPLHAFDYDKVVKIGGSADIHVRAGREGEKLKLLDGREIELDVSDVVIAAGEVAIGLAGAMGGAETEIDSSTKNIILESATFNLYNLRTTQMRHGIFSEAITRFTKGQPAGLTTPVLTEAVRMIGELTGATLASPITDAYPGKRDLITVTVTATQVNDILGTQFAPEDIKAILENVEFAVSINQDDVAVTAPYWRQDIHIAEDIVEEVGRLSGFDMISLTTPSRDFYAVRPNTFELLRAQVRQSLVRAGANEVLTYSFIHGDVMEKAGQNPEQAYRITNSLSPDLQYYRQSLLPSLLVNVHPNSKAGYDHFGLFEFNKFHTKLGGLDEEGVPKELDGLAFVVSRSRGAAGAAFYEAKQYLEYIAKTLGLEFEYEPLEEKSDYPVTQPFEYRRSARIWDTKTHERIGVIGEFRKSVQKAFKLPEYTAGFEISPRALLKLTQALEISYQPLSKYPGTERDICFQVASNITYQQVFDTAKEGLKDLELLTSIEPLDMYQPTEGDTKNITVRIKLASYEKTLKSEDVAVVIDALTERVTKALNATVI